MKTEGTGKGVNRPNLGLFITRSNRKMMEDEFTREKIKKEQAVIHFCVLLLILLFFAFVLLH